MQTPCPLVQGNNMWHVAIMEIKEISFIGYPITDVEKSRSFYEGLLGLKPEMVHEFENSQWWIEYDINGTTLAISNTWPPSGQSGPTMALEVDDLDAWYELIKSKDIPMYLDTVDTPVCRFFGFPDPDGNPLMIHQRKEGCC